MGRLEVALLYVVLGLCFILVSMCIEQGVWLWRTRPTGNRWKRGSF